MTTYLRCSAQVSDDGLYRYCLRRDWSDSAPPLVFVMLNPSTADATSDDPTIRRCVGFARRDGFGGIYVVNLFAWRATKPSDLQDCADRVGGGGNAQALHRALLMAKANSKVVCAWGAHLLSVAPAAEFRRQASGLGVPLYCLGQTSYGAPRHPLYVPGSQPLEVY
jgi:hypothetical protein